MTKLEELIRRRFDELEEEYNVLLQKIEDSGIKNPAHHYHKRLLIIEGQLDMLDELRNSF